MAIVQTTHPQLCYENAIEKELYAQGVRCIAGVDEVGRGALAGPVVAACCVLPPDRPFLRVCDSKRLSAAMREAVFEELTNCSDVYWQVAAVDVQTIDKINIREASLQAMKQAVLALPVIPEYVLVDGVDILSISHQQQAVVHGDALCSSIAAASILAKVTRDRMMIALGEQFSGYGFEKHKGYGTKAHYEAIQQYGISVHHRKSFRLH